MFRLKQEDKAFFRHTMAIALPIIIQNGITNLVSLLDNIMVGQVGTLQMSGVSIANRFLFVFNLTLFGAVSGAGIFTAQFHGSDDHKGVRDTFRYKLVICMAIAVLGIGVFLGFGSQLMDLFLKGEGSPEDAARIREYGMQYLHIMLIGMIPFGIANAYAGTLRETGESVVPMAAGIAAMLTNCALNYVLIFGKLGAPVMGVNGAAVATVISRFVELGVVAVWAHTHTARCRFLAGAYRSMRIPGALLGQIIRKGTPLLVNEMLWAAGMATLDQCYSTCGLHVVPALNISSTIYSLASVVFLSMGNTVGIIMGQLQGANRPVPELREKNRKLVLLSVESCLVFGVLLAGLSGVFPRLYNVEEDIRALATGMICVGAALMPVNAYANAAYFTLRSGGKTGVTFLFDSCFVCLVSVPVAYCLSRFTNLSILPLYLICQALDIFKCVVGFFMLRSGMWIQNLTKLDL